MIVNIINKALINITDIKMDLEFYMLSSTRILEKISIKVCSTSKVKDRERRAFA